ncbi:MAG: hypothetical protein ACFFCD_13990 [Promethearchaeota archaeon]
MGHSKTKQIISRRIPNTTHFDDFEVEHYFPRIERKKILLSC